jgi:hypothetical protein
LQLIEQLLEGVGNVLEEDQTQDDVFVFGSVQVTPELIRRRPEFRFEISGDATSFG